MAKYQNATASCQRGSELLRIKAAGMEAKKTLAIPTVEAANPIAPDSILCRIVSRVIVSPPDYNAKI